MDYLQPEAVISAVAESLQTEVLPRVEDSYARAQIWAATGLLANIAIVLRDDYTEGNDALSAQNGEAESWDDLSLAARHQRDEIARAITSMVSLHYRRSVTGEPATESPTS